MTGHYLHTFLRNFARNKTYSVMNILSLVVGMGVCLVICQYIYFELSYDRFHDNYENTYRVIIEEVNTDLNETSPSIGYSFGVSAKEEIPEVKQVMREQLEAGTLPPEIQLELRQAVGDSASPPLRARAEAIFAQRESASATAAFEDILLGGNRNRGQQIAMQNESAACTRCHILGNQGGADVGPNLQTIGARLTRQQLAEALVDPSAGLEIPSAMPAMQNLLSRHQLRDLVEYLSTLR
jgi:cytochrome c553